MTVDLVWDSDFELRDDPPSAFVEAVRDAYPVEPEVDRMLTRKMQRRGGPPFRRPKLDEVEEQLNQFLAKKLEGQEFRVTNLHWFTGGVSKIQIGFTLEAEGKDGHPEERRLVIRMDPAEGQNATSRAREFELLRLMSDTVPVPETFFLDRDGEWFGEPALIYSFVSGVTKPRSTQSGQISGLGTEFGPELREVLGSQYLEHLARIHGTDPGNREFTALTAPEVGTTQAAEWGVNHALRCWDEDRGEDDPLMEVAASWLLDNLPTLDRVSVVHGDFRSGNFLFDEETGHINAWLDWERGLLGDRHRDLAWITLPGLGSYDERGRYMVCGLHPLEEFFDMYTAASGLTVDPDRVRFYQVLACFNIIVSAMGSAWRVARLGKSHQDILLTRVEGIVPVISGHLVNLLEERR